jgi:hypothetical protein
LIPALLLLRSQHGQKFPTKQSLIFIIPPLRSYFVCARSLINSYYTPFNCVLFQFAAMHRSYALLLALGAGTSAIASSKRGLIYTPNTKFPQDNTIWIQGGSDLTWYYNYQSSPSSVFSGTEQNDFEFVPMLWGAVSGTVFLDSIQSQMASGRNITHALGFNEPDGSVSSGGSEITPSAAAQVWVKNMEPLAAQGVKLGLPACTGSTDGIPWLQQFLANCSQIVSTADVTKNCTYDFASLHWYGDFQGLASHMGSYSAA